MDGKQIPLPWLLPLLLAPFVGSFLGVLVRRLPQRRPVVWTRSECESCGRSLGLREMVPIASYLALRGRCPTCRAPIARFHIVIELAALGVAGWAASVESDPLRLWSACVLGWMLLALAWIDAEYMLLPDTLTLPLILLGLAATWLRDPESMVDHALGAAVGYLAFRGIARLYRMIRRREGLGQADAKLLAAAGAWVGWAALPLLVLMAALAGLGVALLAAAGGRRLRAGTALPFGPFLAAALWLTWLYAAV
jgi:leader peptidase (prepilin peptidase) / N-methyltransferase